MGNYIATYITKPDVMPVPEGPPTFDPMLGFPTGRKPREMLVSEEDMIAAKIPRDRRDYCAHKYMDLLQCHRIHYPVMLKCAYEKHEYSRCRANDTILRLKEYERERRLLERRKRIQQKQAAAA
ncbi:PREDICTED: NADH dehydrogenase [ubiquinone] 1 beta subcomplex subunit 7 [Dinoponera quadriceps]|uniref:NADH dehydrogenase [ubiquinone] 1 beta subcomplex subunit 7 n=1 Tax=Dinoponera quadriceps TaxID=609295 RepID=A0A6P3XJX0_DINQU|nr:PREDICTED: NADH dehydrogenase [ubiquinone] 1 beta subcomplex subunit 7 [Dinoponera quadriceps]